jgi:hypothetical protein
MKSLLLAAVFTAATGSSVLAQSCTMVGAMTYCDPTSFHITDSLATGSSPVFLNEGKTFDVDEINNDVINKPLTIFFSVPIGDAKPTVTKFDYNGGAFTNFIGSLSNDGVWTPGNGKGQDLYSFVGCPACDGSINQTNVDGVDGLGTKFNVYNLVIQQGFSSRGIELIDGTFAKGTIIVPLAENITATKDTFYDTSWTNTGFVNAASVVPETPTWLMMVLGFAGFGVFAALRRRPWAALKA